MLLLSQNDRLLIHDYHLLAKVGYCLFKRTDRSTAYINKALILRLTWLIFAALLKRLIKDLIKHQSYVALPLFGDRRSGHTFGFFYCHQQTVCLHTTSNLTVRPPQHCLFHSAILCDKDDKQSMPGALWRKADSGGGLKAGEKKTSHFRQVSASSSCTESAKEWNRMKQILVGSEKAFYLFIKPLKRGPNQINPHIWPVFISLVISPSSVCCPAQQTPILSTSLNPGGKTKNIYSSNWMKNCVYIIP